MLLLFFAFILWNFCYKWVDEICKSCNVAIRTLLKLPYNTHTIYLCPLINQLDLSKQPYIVTFLFYGMFLAPKTVSLKLL